MLSQFKTTLLKLVGSDNLHPASPDNPAILIAVSGGIDSMCLAHLFYRIAYKNFAVATVNFSLREEESDADEQLVINWANEKGIQVFHTSFDTKRYANSKGISTQMAARDLRYDWFEKLAREYSFSYIATAHNLNDSVETFFLNILRGTGIQGLTGIKKKNGNIIRPLLQFTRREIAEYTKSEQIPFREDATNSEVYYSRNRLRNMVFPEFEMINQSFLKTVERDMENIEAASDILSDLYLQKKEILLDLSTNRISIPALLKENRPDYWLYMILSEYGFNSLQCEQIYDSLLGQPGKEFHSDSTLVLKDRDNLLIYSKGTLEESSICDNDLVVSNIQCGTKSEFSFEGSNISFSCYSKPDNFSFKKKADLFDNPLGDLFGANVLYMDADKVKFPVIIRKWKDGDKFIPLGMTGYKKISDYLTDIKLNRFSKDKQSVITSGGEVIALTGHRVDDKYKVTPFTKNILEVTLCAL